MPTTSLDEATVPFPDGEPGQPSPASTADQPAGRRPAEPDTVCAQAVALARGAAEDLAGTGEVGDHLGLLAEGERLVTHYFACRAKGYRGWRWAVTVARAPRVRSATVCETVLLPGDDAILAPAWVPWSDRLAPGDLGAADVLPYREDDPLLEPGYAQTGDEDTDRIALWELGLGRPRVLGPLGRDEAVARWYHGDRGPTADEAVHAAAACSTCGYFLPLAGALRQVFGVCANEWSPSDGRVVSVDHGCGAHSETDVERLPPLPLPEPILDETGAEAVVLPPRPPADEPAAAPVPAAAEADDAGADDGTGSGTDDGTGSGTDDADLPAAPPEDAPAWTDPGFVDPPGGDPAEGAPGEGEPVPGESGDEGLTGGPGGIEPATGEPPMVVGDGVSSVPVTPVHVTPLIEVDPTAEPEPGESGHTGPWQDPPKGSATVVPTTADPQPVVPTTADLPGAAPVTAAPASSSAPAQAPPVVTHSVGWVPAPEQVRTFPGAPDTPRIVSGATGWPESVPPVHALGSDLPAGPAGGGEPER